MRAPAEPTLTEEACLDEVMRLRFTGAPCAACGDRQGFLRESRNRAYSCRSCGLKIFPCQGTPFVKPRPSLVVWFEAIDLVARTGAGAGVLRRRLKVDPRTAADIEAGIGRLKAAADPATDARWFPEIATFVHGHRANGRPAVRRDETGPETLWESLCAIASHAPAGHRPYLGLVAIAALMMVGVGVGWLIVPQAPEPDEEIEQATATLTLGEDKPVIIVSADLAAQLYDVTDVDADPTSPLASSIRVAPRAGQKGPGAAPDAQSLAPPAVKLSAGAGKSLVEGDIGAVRLSAGNRPELAAYSALAQELEGNNSRNPDELLIFGPMRIRRYLVEKIVRASRATSVDPVLLMAIADKESSFKTEVQAQTSSASGLYQFIEKTWLGVVREFGPRYGLAQEAAVLATGDMTAQQRTRILDMRRDPYLSAVLAAEMLKRDSLRIARRIGRNLTGGEVYLVHFLGPDGAERMIDEVTHKPDTVAAALLPKPAAANRPIFYSGGGGKSLSVSEVRSKFETMISLRLDRYSSVKAVKVPNTPEPRILPASAGQ